MKQNRNLLRQKLLTVPTCIVLSLLICAILALGFLLAVPNGTRVTAAPDGTRVTSVSPNGIRVNGSSDAVTGG